MNETWSILIQTTLLWAQVIYIYLFFWGKPLSLFLCWDGLWHAWRRFSLASSKCNYVSQQHNRWMTPRSPSLHHIFPRLSLINCCCCSCCCCCCYYFRYFFPLSHFLWHFNTLNPLKIAKRGTLFLCMHRERAIVGISNHIRYMWLFSYDMSVQPALYLYAWSRRSDIRSRDTI